jgi:hypothetical protein
MEHCNFSTGAAGEITAGRGRLSPLGYWEFPCDECQKRATHRFEEWREMLKNQERLLAALKALTLNNEDLSQAMCHLDLCSAEQCSRCGPILNARKLIAEIEKA